MSSIRFSNLTKEIEMKGSESFIESNFNKIQDLLVESFGVKNMTASGNMKTNRESISVIEIEESRADAGIKSHELSEASSIASEVKSSIPEISHDVQAKRPPLRKYIRREGIPGHQRVVVQVIEQKPREISIASLKEKFGLSGSKIGGIVRNTEKPGKLRKAMNGSYVWMED